MATFAVDSNRQQMVATGVVEPVMEWVETAEGKRRPGDNQARQDGTGLPLWGVEVVYQSESWGRVSTESVKVTVPAMEMPAPSLFTPIQFSDLVASVRVDRRNNGLSTSWEAAGIAEMSGAKALPKAA
ncbi:hypothetical protein C8K30_1037 [Promicromonospora sp. AC04]|jgi:hypothetical protein|uniref:hypothetical protein n=1 Tax=Promicromonospora sp. AC04 TaxID=2135723 RepID=UPI000D34CE0F|nr:hypothetical protein [Promicromonospora sp. AC04]PUB28591.1 hypothetical protein C8K30_1037 [Promicromonospora sp. AC04]